MSLVNLCHSCVSCYAEELNLKAAYKYEYLKQSDCLTIDNVDDAKRFHVLMVNFSSSPRPILYYLELFY